ncbi:Glycine cleavage system H protein [subsurface metagenome]
MYPDDLKYNNEHTWLRLEGDTKGRVGITYYAQEQLKEVVFVELPDVGVDVVHMEPFGVIESAKATNDLYSPVSGVVAEVNHSLESEPNLVNSDPYGKGWMIVVELSDPAELDRLLSAEEYQAVIGG